MWNQPNLAPRISPRDAAARPLHSASLLRKRQGSVWLRGFSVSLCLFVFGCGQPEPQSPRDVLVQYASALEQGRIEDAHRLLSAEAQRSLPLETFRRMVEDNPAEAKRIAESLVRPSGPALVTASVTAPNGDELLLIYEGGEWRVDGSAIDLYSQATPKAALAAFIRAYENKRWDILLRFAPKDELEGLTSRKLEEHWGGDKKEEMDRLIQVMKSTLASGQVEVIGDRASFSYGAGGLVELVFEENRWKVQELK